MAVQVWLRIRLPDEWVRQLQDSMPACEFRRATDAEADPAWLQEVAVVYAGMPLSDDLVQRMPRLQWVHAAWAAVGRFLVPAMMERPIQVSSSKGIHGPPFAEYGLACIFALARELPRYCQDQAARRWAPATPPMVAGQTLGIIGLGTIGRELAWRAKALGMRVIATKATVDGKPDFVDALGPPDYLPTLLREADFVVLSAPDVPSTFNLLGEAELRLMKPTAYLINIAPKQAVREELLVRALREGWIGGAALDALPREPLPPESELWGLPNVLITPRVAGPEFQWDRLLPIFTRNLECFLAGEPLPNGVDKAKGY
jgi:phosphoglycerate dehydrogenase-like enzyme